MKVHKELKQGSPEWFEVRKLKMTASHAQAIGNNGAGLKTYIEELLAEYFSSAEKEHISNEHTERGNELEPEARALYELENNVFVEEVGFIEHTKHSGVSPDGLISDNGLLEIKCPSDKNYLKQLVNPAIPSAYMWQMQMQMLISEREWCDYMIYNPNFKKDYVVTRVLPDEKMQEKLKTGLESGEKTIIEMVEKLNKEI